MKKYLFLLISAIFMIISLSACSKNQAGILFNNLPITKETVANASMVFQSNQRIYYLIYFPKKVKTQHITVRVMKKDNKYEMGAYKLYWSRDVRLREEEIYYYSDYVVLSERGAYTMQVYSKDNPTKILCYADLWVRE